MYINFTQNREELQVSKNISGSTVKSKSKRKGIYVFVKELPSKLNPKSRKVIVVVTLGMTFWFSSIKPSKAMGSSLPPSQIVRIHKSSYDSRSKIRSAKIRSAKIVSRKLNKICLTTKLDKICLTTTDQTIPLIFINSHYFYINEELLKKLRAGDLSANLTIVAIGVIVYVMCQLSGVDSFSILNQIGRWNAPTCTHNFGPTSSSSQIALIPTRAQEFNDMSLKFNEPKLNYIMTRDNALKLIKETYPGELKITDTERISDWQAAKKIYHAYDFNINPEDYGMTKIQLSEIQRLGLTKYVRLGKELPPLELIKDYQAALKEFCKNSERLPSGKYNSRGNQIVYKSSFYFNEDTQKIVSFNIETQDLITASTYNFKEFSLFRITKTLGKL